MNHPLKEIIEWANHRVYWTEYDTAKAHAKQEVLQILQKYINDPDWICLEGMTAGELQAYDYGCASAEAAVRNVLDGKDQGHGVANEPWQSLRKRLLALVGLWRACGN